MVRFARWLGPVAVVLAGVACGGRNMATGDASAGAGHAAGHASGSSAAGRAGGASSPALDAGREIVVRECFAPPLTEDVAIVPGLYCTEAPRFAECHSGIECLGPWDCEPKPFARCLGLTGLRCVYPGVDPAPAAGGLCESAADCTQAPGGRCELAITHSTCQYNAQCERDVDCGPDARCACGLSGDTLCVAAECWADADCGAGERCRRDYACGFQLGGFFCTHSQQECRADEDCAVGYCDYDEVARAWSCSNEGQCTIP